jgi:hypothetical protein
MTEGDRAQLRRELSERDSLYLAAYRLGYVNVRLHPVLEREWDVRAAWLSGRDWARRDRRRRRWFS